MIADGHSTSHYLDRRHLLKRPPVRQRHYPWRLLRSWPSHQEHLCRLLDAVSGVNALCTAGSTLTSVVEHLPRTAVIIY